MATAGFGQTAGVGITSQSIRMLQERDLIDRPKPQVGTPKPDGTKTGDLPPGDPYRKEFKLIHADGFRKNGPIVTLIGAVEFEDRGYKVFADQVEGNIDTGDYRMEGKVKVIGKDALIDGERISINTNLRTFIAESAKSVLRPGLVKGSIRDDLFIEGARFSGDERRQIGEEDDVTTCNLDHPHYQLHARNSDLIRGDRLILRHVDFIVFGRKYLTIPYLYIPLREQTYNYLPEVGQSPDEGFYIKNRVGIPLHGDNNRLVARLDYMSKLGEGIGGEYAYKVGHIAGLLKAYTIIGGDQRTVTINHSHRQEFRWGSLSVDTDYQQNNYLSAPGSTLVGIRGSLALRPDANGSSSRLTFSRSGSSSDSYSSFNDSVAVSDQRIWNKRLKTTLDVTMTKSSSSNSSSGTTTSDTREQVDIRFRGDEDLKQATASLEVQRSVPVGHLDNFFGSADRYPVLSLMSDISRLFGPKARVLPFRTEFSLGSFADPVTQSNITRTYFDFNFNRSAGKGKLKWDTNGDFRQALYSDDTAQYVLTGGTNLSYQVGKDTYANLRYNYNRPYGYSPLQIDRTGYIHSTSIDLSYRLNQRFSAGVQTGYDISRLDTKDIPWQQIGIKTEYSVKDFLLFRTQTSYDTLQEAWSNVRLDLTWKRRNESLGIGARFDGLRHTWSNANVFIENITTGKTTVSASLNYNGFTQQFDTQQYNFVYSLHCWEAVLSVIDNATGFRSGREINLFFRLKAFPFQSPFGTSRQGSPINFGNGSNY